MNKIHAVLVDQVTNIKHNVEIKITTEGVDVNFLKDDGHYRGGVWLETYDGKAVAHVYVQGEDGYEKDEPQDIKLFDDSEVETLIPLAEI